MSHVFNLTDADFDAVFANLDPEHYYCTSEGIDCALLSSSGGGGGGTPPSLKKASNHVNPQEPRPQFRICGKCRGFGSPLSAPEVGPVEYKHGGSKLMFTEDISSQVGQPTVLSGWALDSPVVNPVVLGP